MEEWTEFAIQKILSKIRAEIKAASHGKWYVGRVDGKTEEVLLMDEVMEIIDKYRKDLGDYPGNQFDNMTGSMNL